MELDESEQEDRIVSELRSAGYVVDSIGQLAAKYTNYSDAVDILARWIPLTSYPSLKEALYRALAVRFAKRALPTLIQDFESVPLLDENWMLRCACGNSIEVLWDDREFERLSALCLDVRYGRSREMVVRGLAKSKRPEAIPVLISLLEDGDCRVPAIIALRKQRPSEARERLQSLREEVDDRWIAKEIDKTLLRIG